MVVSKSMPQSWLNEVESFFIRKGSTNPPLRDNHISKDFHSDLFRSLLRINYVHRGRVSCFFSVLPPFINIFDGLHGGVIGSIAERIGIACARTVVAEEKELFLGDLKLSYLSAAPLNEECVVDASMLKSGRNISVVGMEFRIRKTQKLLFIAQTTFFHTTPAVANCLSYWTRFTSHLTTIDQMTKTKASASSPPQTTTTSATVSKHLPPQYATAAEDFLVDCGISGFFSDKYDSKDFYSDLIRDLLRTDTVQRGRVSCIFSVLPAVTNLYNGLLGGAIGAIAERVAIACARTVVPDDKKLFVGELSISYLSAAPQGEELVVDASVMRSGRNLTVIVVEFRIKKSQKLVYHARATLFQMPISRL